MEKSSGSSGTMYWPGPSGEILAETDLSGNLNEEYVYFNGARLARVDRPSGTVHYYFSDHLSSSSAITDASGNVQQRYYYFPYGGMVSSIGSDSNHYEFTGKERDSESGLDNFGARYFTSTMGRFMTPDWAARPTTVPYAVFGDPQSLNLYGYVRNDPVSRADADGHGGLGRHCDSSTGKCHESDAPGAESEQQGGQNQNQAQNKSPLDKAAMAAEKEALGLTRAALKAGHHVEYGGYLIESKKDGSITYTKPIKGGEGEIDLSNVKVPKGFSVVGEYHTHPHTTRDEGEGADAGDVNHLRYVAGTEHVDRPGYVADTYSGNVYRYTQWEPIKSLYDTRTFGTNIGNIPPD